MDTLADETLRLILPARSAFLLESHFHQKVLGRFILRGDLLFQLRPALIVIREIELVQEFMKIGTLRYFLEGFPQLFHYSQ